MMPPPLESARVHLALGSNVGDRLSNLRQALCRLGPRFAVDVVSALYETRPMGPQDQPWYLNAACAGSTQLKPKELLAFAKEIEHAMGRASTVRWGPRVIDIDILFYADLVLDCPDLVIPHPGMAHRVFVLAPLADIAPLLIHPVLEQSVSALLNRLPPEPDGVRRIAESKEWYPCTK